MAYRRFQRYSKPTVRNIAVKYAGNCACCGARIEVGSIATYYPVGTIASVTEAKIAHVGGLEGNSTTCFNVLKNKVDAGLNDFAGDGLDSRYEDDCRDKCGL